MEQLSVGRWKERRSESAIDFQSMIQSDEKVAAELKKYENKARAQWAKQQGKKVSARDKDRPSNQAQLS